MKKKLLFSFVLFAFSLSGCVSNSVSEKLPLPSTEPGKVYVKGCFGNENNIENKNTVFAAEYQDMGTGGIFLLEPNIFPKSKVINNCFLLDNLKPGKYVLLVGQTPDSVVPIWDTSNDSTQIFDLQSSSLELNSLVVKH